jgi:hypothetical protein
LSTTYIPAKLRQQVIARAEHLCGYCFIHEDDTFFGCEVDHIISEKHGGATSEENLALACLTCNRNKGSDVASLVPQADALVRFFNPRRDFWSAHSRLGSDGITLLPLTDIGEATARILGFNTSERLLERHALHRVGRYPSRAAQKRISSSGKAV